MTFTTARVCPDDIDEIFADLSAQHAAEFEASDIEQDAARDIFRTLVRDTGGTAILLDEQPVAAFGFRHVRDVRSIWFVASARYFAAGALAVRFSRALLARERGGPQIVAATMAPHPDVPRWLTAIGFTPTGERRGHRVFVL